MSEIRKLGNMANSNQRMALYEKEGIAPCFTTCGGGGLTPYIYECKCLGGLGEKKSNGGTQYYQQDRVYSMGDAAMCEPANIPGGSYRYLEIKKMNEINVLGNYMPSEHDASRVVDTNGLAPTVKENHGTVTGVVEIGYLEKGTGKHQSNVVYSEDGLAPTACASYGVKQPPAMHCEIVAYDDYNSKIRKDQETLGTITTNIGNDEKRTKIVEIKQATKQGYIPCEVGGVADLNYPDSTTRRGRVQGNGQICPTLTTENIPSVLEPWVWEIDGVRYLIRIRKLTPRECWRLMDFTDEDFEKAQAVNSNTQLYKQAGNSIVKNVLVEALRPIFTKESVKDA